MISSLSKISSYTKRKVNVYMSILPAANLLIMASLLATWSPEENSFTDTPPTALISRYNLANTNHTFKAELKRPLPHLPVSRKKYS